MPHLPEIATQSEIARQEVHLFDKAWIARENDRPTLRYHLLAGSDSRQQAVRQRRPLCS